MKNPIILGRPTKSEEFLIMELQALESINAKLVNTLKEVRSMLLDKSSQKEFKEDSIVIVSIDRVIKDNLTAENEILD